MNCHVKSQAEIRAAMRAFEQRITEKIREVLDQEARKMFKPARKRKRPQKVRR